MPIDQYAACPGGTGKKIKFCCPDLVTELDKIQRMLEGEQNAAALDHINKLEAKFPGRACLMSMQAMLDAQAGNAEKSHATLAAFQEKYPGNPVALAEIATLKAAEEGGVAGIGPLQDAMEHCSQEVPAQVYDAIGMVAQTLIADSQIIAARAHLVLQIGLGGTKDQRPLSLLMRLNGSPQVPLLAKQDMPLLPAPDDALWKQSFAKALEPAMRGCWREAADQLTELAGKIGDWPVLWHNVAVLRAWLADNPRAIAALRKFAAQKIPLEDAAEAEALAQAMDPAAADHVDLLTVPLQVNDIEVLLARLAASNRALAMPIDLARLGTPEEPPPKAAYWLLDKPIAPSGREITRDQITHVAGQVFVFGKQTDRAARLELVVYRDEVPAAQAILAEIGESALGSAGAEEVTTQVPAVEHLLNFNWRLPIDTPPERRLQLMNEERRDLLLNRWPQLKQQILGGKSPSEVAGDESQRVKLAAAILLLELSTAQYYADFDFNELRTKLGVPPLQTIDPATVNLAELSLLRLARVDDKKASDEALLDLFHRADHYRHVTALRKLAHEVIERPSLEGKEDRAEVLGILAQIEPDTHKALAYLDQAKAAAETAKKSTAPWDLAELALRIGRGDMQDADRLLNHIRAEHIREPGVAQALFQILSEAGIIGPDGKPTAAAGAGREAPSIVVPGGAAEPGKIWTPGSDQPSGKKSALWTPGMD